MRKCVLNVVVVVLLCWQCVSAQTPTITVSKKSVMLEERETASVTLLTALCSTTNGKACSVDLRSILPTNPCGNCFDVLPCALTSFCVMYLPGQGTLNPSITSRYTLTLQATDELGNKALTAVDINIQPNTPPYFDPATYTDMHKYGVLSNGGSVQVKATDDEGDILTYSMTIMPSTTGIRIDPLSGIISATRDLSYECRNTFSALVYVQDNYHSTQSGPLSVTLDIANANIRPTINNVNPGELYILENEKVTNVVKSLVSMDDGTADLKYNVSTSPPTAAGLLRVDTVPLPDTIAVAKALDYESQPKTFTMDIQGSDGYCTTDHYKLNVHIVDVNEPPTLYPIDQTIDSCEGLVDIKPYWNASDPDENDQITFTSILPNDQGRFKIDPHTGLISTTVDYDLDVDKLADTVIELVTLSDIRGLTAIATVTILFQDCNDNAPTFSKPGKEYLMRDCWPVGTAIDNVILATDLDSSFNQNNVIEYSGSGNGIRVLPSGSIVTTKLFTAGETTTFPVHATDKGKVPGPLTSKAFYVSVYTLPCIVPDPNPKTTPANTTAALPDPFGEPNVASNAGNLAWIALAALLAAILLSLLLYFLWRYCWTRLRQCCRPGNWCKRKPPPLEDRGPARRPTPPPDTTGPGFIFGWWKETYPNNDYTHTPDRSARPEASKGPEFVDTNTYDVDPVIPPTPPPAQPTKSCHIL